MCILQTAWNEEGSFYSTTSSVLAITSWWMCCESPPFRFVPETQNCCNKSQCIRRRRLPPSPPPPKKKKPPRNWFSDSIWGGGAREGEEGERRRIAASARQEIVPLCAFPSPIWGGGKRTAYNAAESGESVCWFFGWQGGQLFRVEPGKTRTYFTQRLSCRERPKENLQQRRKQQPRLSQFHDPPTRTIERGKPLTAQEHVARTPHPKQERDPFTDLRRLLQSSDLIFPLIPNILKKSFSWYTHFKEKFLLIHPF